MARHGSLAEQLTALLAYRNRPEGPIEPMQSNWTVVPANDDIAVKSFSHERDLRVTPSVEEIMRQVETGDVEKNAKGQTVRIGNLRFSDGTQTEKAFKRTGGRSVVHGGEKTIQWSAGVCAGAGGVKVGHWIG